MVPAQAAVLKTTVTISRPLRRRVAGIRYLTGPRGGRGCARSLGVGTSEGSISFRLGVPVLVSHAIFVEDVGHLFFHLARCPPFGKGIRLRRVGREVRLILDLRRGQGKFGPVWSLGVWSRL